MSEDHFSYLIESGQKHYRCGRNNEARTAFLQACRKCYEYAKSASSAEEKADWIERAERVRAMAEKIELGGGTKAAPLPAEPKESISDGSSRQSGSQWKAVKRPDIKFDDIAGLDDVKDLIRRRVIFPMQNPEMAKIYKRNVGAGVMMYGPPGTGKTMIAKAIAGELDCPFFEVKSSAIMSKWAGDSEHNIRDLFIEARKQAPSVLFFDEAEALLVKRDENSPVMGRVVPEFLAQVDGVSAGAEGLLLIGATNCPWKLDPAAVRPGRFGEKIYIPLPDAKAREFLLRRNFASIPGADACIDYAELSYRIEGFSGADINGLADRIIDPVYDRANRMGSEAVPVTFEDVENGLRQVRPSVSQKDIIRYERYRDIGE